MSVDPDISRQIIREEVEAMSALASTYGWTVNLDFPKLTVTLHMRSNVDNQVFIVEAKCDDYKALPPIFEFIHPETSERGTPTCYPAGGSYFHKTPCICVQWNRKAYRQLGGPHGNWEMINWMKARPGMTTLGDMFHLIQIEINKKSQYTGRMG